MTNPWEDAAREHEVQKAALHNAKKHNEELHGMISRLEAKQEILQKELDNAKARSDHYLRLYCEICKNLNTIGLVVDDALNTARIEVVGKHNGREIPQQLVDQVEQSVKELQNVPVQHENRDQRRPADNEIHRRS